MPTTPNDQAAPTFHGVLLIDVKEVSRRLGLSERTVWRLTSAGKVPRPLTIGGKAKRWRADEITTWVEAGCPAQTQWEAQRRRFDKAG